MQKASIERKNNTKHTFAYQKLKIELQRSKSIYYSWVEEKFNYIYIQYICFEVKKSYVPNNGAGSPGSWFCTIKAICSIKLCLLFWQEIICCGLCSIGFKYYSKTTRRIFSATAVVISVLFKLHIGRFRLHLQRFFRLLLHNLFRVTITQLF